MNLPDVLVLGGGGVLGEAWMNALLAGVEQAGGFDARAAASFIGTSAGSIVAAQLVGGVSPRERLARLGGEPGHLEPAPAGEAAGGRWSPPPLSEPWAAAVASLTSFALSSSATAAAGAMLRRALLATAPAGGRALDDLGLVIERLDVPWDGRLRIAAVDLDSGRRVMFGSPDAPPVTVSQAVQASCAIPGVFQPLRVDGRAYVDGGVWSPTNMDAAEVSRGASVVCLNPTGSMRPSSRAPAGALGAVSRSIAAAEALALRHRGASVRVVNPDEACRRAMGANLLDPRPRSAVIASAFEQGKRLAHGTERS